MRPLNIRIRIRMCPYNKAFAFAFAFETNYAFAFAFECDRTHSVTSLAPYDPCIIAQMVSDFRCQRGPSPVMMQDGDSDMRVCAHVAEDERRGEVSIGVSVRSVRIDQSNVVLLRIQSCLPLIAVTIDPYNGRVAF